MIQKLFLDLVFAERSMLKNFLFLLQISFLSSCSTEAPRETYLFSKIINSDYRGLLFTARKGIHSSILYWYNFKTGIVEEILNGQSGDPKLFLIKDKIYLFNRMGFQKNYLILDTQNNFELLQPEKSSFLSSGDPYFLLPITEDYSLLSCLSEGKIKLFNLKSGVLNDLYTDNMFRPGNLILKKDSSGKKHIYTLSLGLNDFWSPDSSQKIYDFILEKNPNFTLKLQSTKKTNASYSETLFENTMNSNELFSFSLAYEKGESSYDRINLSNLDVTQAHDLSDLSSYEKFGSPVLTQDGFFLTPVKEKTSGERKIKSIFFNPFKETDYHPLERKTSSISLVYDKSNNCVFIGENEETKNGKIHFYCGDKKVFTEEIDLDFYEGVLIP